ncbi:sulfatase family protein [Roseimaritima sediminicola]|uniref:sulfatase family protein n=1 Tax=Roseimaritima sediminicola TaxID=2662066 RepID=UPI0028F3F8DE|nr:arylsulfatase [Roseimaritima sediminicola]
MLGILDHFTTSGIGSCAPRRRERRSRWALLPGLMLAALVVSLWMGADASAASDAPPNVVLIYVDDCGYGDVSALNPEAKFNTPNLDRLARGGVAFTRGYSPDSVCTPSRYGLLTGRYAWRTHLKRGVFGAEAPCLIADGRMTLASLLKSQGYRTAIVGKWHLGMDFPGTPENRDWSQPVRDMPLDKGFDYFYGIPASLNFGILAWFEGRHAAVPPTQYTGKKPNPRYVDYRIRPPYHESRLNERGKSNGFEVAPDFIDNQCLTRFTDKAIEWMKSHAAQSEADQPFFLYLPYTSPHYPVCPLPRFHGEGDAGAYGEFMIETDHHVGRVLKYLQQAGLEENTIVIFTSDNGPERSWEGRIKRYGHDSRGGLREGKRSVYEGGHRVPLLVRWPAGIVDPGRRSDRVVGQVDVLATLADLLDVSLPADAGEDSQSFAAVLTEPAAVEPRLPLVTHGNGRRDYRYAIIDGDWKLVMRDARHEDELYNWSKDRQEQNNLAAAHPEVVQRLTRELTEIVLQGRTTPGPPQSNDTGHWEDLTWITKETP